ncbi:2-amino-4-hydroxy-6-hydroxymethyldihydropteridine diphosphokinase [Halomonas sp. PAMB 3232]|uniref:2-amino-4-hydroxy-6- hydroxymethyldihydropteridine diphosphokinase n=1 Tax=Halomonas sp. PAMB 3232 TaxID=3075221 RepID=UPI00289DF913|nr:2-amino-4-hydroxy-6-hydroxymethyldihydropteridine diphosphokinase [Halomonas sp. PAMB 3232]WNL39339.1 2-amino-4-hydroxy-6-hydroxymethyldihydropteridine diphosphokinase [Halomonas sp. PAMB 3232]
MGGLQTARAYIGLGSNLDEPVRQVSLAMKELDELPLTSVKAASSLYSSRPVGPQDQPDFVNAVVELETTLSPLALLDQLQALEQRHRRRRLRHWGPRTLDLDLLLFDDARIEHPRLKVPHPHMRERAFVLVPLQELDPSLAVFEQAPDHWLQRLDDPGLQRIGNSRG